MKNITLKIGEKVSSVNRFMRDFLARIAERQNRAREVRRRIRELSNRSTARIGSKTWSRDDLHER